MAFLQIASLCKCLGLKPFNARVKTLQRVKTLEWVDTLNCVKRLTKQRVVYHLSQTALNFG
eukprot:1190279-Amphidinium_carterae.1